MSLKKVILMRIRCEIRILEYLKTCQEPVNLYSLAKKIGFTYGPVYQNVKKMKEKGLINVTEKPITTKKIFVELVKKNI